MAAFPPCRFQTSKSIPAEDALEYLQKYLAATKTSPYLLPNARLEASGPSASSTTSSLTMHNLRRVEAGLRGEWLAPVLDMGEAVPVAIGIGRVDNGDTMDVEGWQDLDEYQREQSDVEGEIVQKSMAVDLETGEGQDESVEVEAGAAPHKVAKKAKESKDDKAAKKLEKKARLKEEQKKRAEEKRRAGEAAKQEV